MDRGNWKVLLIDDEPDSLDLIYDMLTLHGIEVQRAASGTMGLALLETFTPTVIVVDLAMPDINGWELLARVRQRPDLADVPVVAITAYYSASVAEAARQAGFDAFLPKPIKSGELLRRLSEVIG